MKKINILLLATLTVCTFSGIRMQAAEIAPKRSQAKKEARRIARWKAQETKAMTLTLHEAIKSNNIRWATVALEAGAKIDKRAFKLANQADNSAFLQLLTQEQNRRELRSKRDKLEQEYNHLARKREALIEILKRINTTEKSTYIEQELKTLKAALLDIFSQIQKLEQQLDEE